MNVRRLIWVILGVSLVVMTSACTSSSSVTHQIQDSLYREDSLLAVFVMNKLKPQVNFSLIGDSVRVLDTIKGKWSLPTLTPDLRKKPIIKDTTEVCDSIPIKKDSLMPSLPPTPKLGKSTKTSSPTKPMSGISNALPLSPPAKPKVDMSKPEPIKPSEPKPETPAAKPEAPKPDAAKPEVPKADPPAKLPVSPILEMP